jgi:hypothetical protein
VFGALVFGLALSAFLASPFVGLDTLPSLGVVVIGLGVLLRDLLLARCAARRDRRGHDPCDREPRRRTAKHVL